MKHLLNFNGKTISLEEPKVMGILNVTNDSFFDGGRYTDADAISVRATQMLEDGASIIDIGAQSTRPGAALIDVEQEINTISEAIDAVFQANTNAFVSVDTFRSEVAEVALDKGAFMINDVSGGTLDDHMATLISKRNAPYVLMHMRGTPETMMDMTDYNNLVEDVLADLKEKSSEFLDNGASQLIIDPGFGFAKTMDQNYELFKHLDRFHELGHPVLVGISRKSMIQKKLNISADEALNATTVLNTLALAKGTKIIRVHDVKEAAQAISLHKLVKS